METILADPHHLRADLRTTNRAVKNGWLSDEERHFVKNEMLLIVGRNPDPKYKIGAGRVLVSMDSVNVRREQMALDAAKPTGGVNVNILAQQASIDLRTLTDKQLVAIQAVQQTLAEPKAEPSGPPTVTPDGSQPTGNEPQSATPSGSDNPPAPA